MSEWTEERHEELKGIAHDCGTNVFSHVRSRELIDAVDEIERLKAEVDTLRGQQEKLIEAGNDVLTCTPEWYKEHFDLRELIDEITGGTK